MPSAYSTAGRLTRLPAHTRANGPNAHRPITPLDVTIRRFTDPKRHAALRAGVGIAYARLNISQASQCGMKCHATTPPTQLIAPNLAAYAMSAPQSGIRSSRPLDRIDVDAQVPPAASSASERRLPATEPKPEFPCRA